MSDSPKVGDTWNLLLCSPLHIFMQALVNSSIVEGDHDLVNDAVLYLFGILRAIRKAEDAVDMQMTTVKYFSYFTHQLILISDALFAYCCS